MNFFKFRNHQIPVDENYLLNLTQCWRANDSPKNREPSRWKDLESSRRFIKNLKESFNSKDFEVYKILKNPNNKGYDSWAHWQIAYQYAQWLNPRFAMKINEIVEKFQKADMSLAHSIIRRNKDISNFEDFQKLKDIESIEDRKASMSFLDSALKKCKAAPDVPSIVKRNNSVSVTGLIPNKIKEQRNFEEARDAYTFKENVEMSFLELMQAEKLNDTYTKDNRVELVSICANVAKELKVFKNKIFGVIPTIKDENIPKHLKISK